MNSARIMPKWQAIEHYLAGAAIAGVYRAATKQMVAHEALVLGVGQVFFVVAIAFLRILATL